MPVPRSGGPDFPERAQEEYPMKKTAIILMILMILLLPSAIIRAEALNAGDYTYEILENGTAEITGFQGEGTDIEIPAMIDDLPVTSIGHNAFAYKNALKSVSIPEGVISIGDHAFAESPAIESIRMPESLVRIGNGAFQGCVLLKEAVLPAGLVRIGWNPFDRCDLIGGVVLPEGNPFYTVQDGVLYDQTENRLISYPSGLRNESYTVPEWVTAIGMAAFSENRWLTEITIPEGMTELAGNPFCGCTALKQIRLPDLHPVYEITRNALYNNQTRTLIAYLWTKNENTYEVQPGTLAIGQEAFYRHAELTGISLPNSVITVGEAAFASSGLISIRLPDSIVSLGHDAFNNCPNLVSVKLPSDLTAIGDSLFYKCVSLRSIVLPGAVRSIGNAAFYLCQSLTNVSIPRGTQTIGDYAFAGCFNLSRVTIPESVTGIGKDVFYSVKDVELTAPVGSYAEEWAKENGIRLKEPKRLPTDMI